jgi:hypothetical protein
LVKWFGLYTSAAVSAVAVGLLVVVFIVWRAQYVTTYNNLED